MKFRKNKGYRKSIHIDDIIKQRYDKIDTDIDYDTYRTMCRTVFEMAVGNLNNPEMPHIHLPKLGKFQPVMSRVYTLMYHTVQKYDTGVIQYKVYKERIKTLINYVKTHYINGRRKGK